jgi:hypothetical protein
MGSRVKRKEPYEEAEARLRGLADRIIGALVESSLGIEEGEVATRRPGLYRRLDCPEGALAYVRVRPKKRTVRIDVTGRWPIGQRPRIVGPSAAGAASLMVENDADADLAVEILLAAVLRARSAEAGVEDPRDG